MVRHPVGVDSTVARIEWGVEPTVRSTGWEWSPLRIHWPTGEWAHPASGARTRCRRCTASRAPCAHRRCRARPPHHRCAHGDDGARTGGPGCAHHIIGARAVRTACPSRCAPLGCHPEARAPEPPSHRFCVTCHTVSYSITRIWDFGGTEVKGVCDMGTSLDPALAAESSPAAQKRAARRDAHHGTVGARTIPAAAPVARAPTAPGRAPPHRRRAARAPRCAPPARECTTSRGVDRTRCPTPHPMPGRCTASDARHRGGSALHRLGSARHRDGECTASDARRRGRAGASFLDQVGKGWASHRNGTAPEGGEVSAPGRRPGTRSAQEATAAGHRGASPRTSDRY